MKEKTATTPEADRLPELVLAFYGDDFTGSTAVLQSLAASGLRTLLFRSPPDRETLGKYPGLRAFGIAGVSRSLWTSEMEGELRDAFSALCKLAPPLLHYKVCSTFDTSPEIGSIGKALEIGWELCGKRTVPIVVGAPALGRYCIFGNLFATAGDEQIYRLDKHPTMSRHPITPMRESDLREVLAKETTLRTNLIDLNILRIASADEISSRFAKSDEVSAIVFDTLDSTDLEKIGEVLWQSSLHTTKPETRFVIGSTGVEDALYHYWRRSELLEMSAPIYVAGAVDQLICLSGSCSPVTDRQITFALQSGFSEIAIDPIDILNQGISAFVSKAVTQAREILSTGASLIIHTARGPEDPRIGCFSQKSETLEKNAQPSEVIGTALGKVLHSIESSREIKRIVLAGGDTSGYIARQLDIEALEYRGDLAVGVPLCNAFHSNGSAVEIAFKGGQVGGEDFFVKALNG